MGKKLKEGAGLEVLLKKIKHEDGGSTETVAGVKFVNGLVWLDITTTRYEKETVKGQRNGKILKRVENSGMDIQEAKKVMLLLQLFLGK